MIHSGSSGGGGGGGPESTTVLVTGGAGYVGSHSTLLLLEQNLSVIVVDNCRTRAGEVVLDSNGNYCQQLPESLRRVQQLAGKKLTAFYGLDLVEDGANGKLDEVFHRHHIDVVIHFAALKSIPESLSRPLDYYTNNLSGTINLLNAMKRHGCRNLIFSSSATVYGLPQYLPVDEKHQVGLNILNPYGRTKCMIEDILSDLCRVAAVPPPPPPQAQACNGAEATRQSMAWSIISLRYFNPVGAHESGFIGEYSEQAPNNLMPFVSQVAAGRRAKLSVFGNDFDTKDGTGVRDYIHIMDLARGHTHALEHLLSGRAKQQQQQPDGAGGGGNYQVYNLGTGRGYSVLEVIETFERVNGVRVPYEIVARREGDAGEVYADPSRALAELGWSAKHSLVEMCRDTFRWQSNYPDGFKSSE